MTDDLFESHRRRLVRQWGQILAARANSYESPEKAYDNWYAETIVSAYRDRLGRVERHYEHKLEQYKARLDASEEISKQQFETVDRLIWKNTQLKNQVKHLETQLANLRLDPALVKAGAQPAGADDDAGKCVICLVASVERVIVPCGHFCLCQQCQVGADHTCPMCRNPVDAVIKIHRA